MLSPFQRKKVDDTLRRVDQGRARPWEEAMETSEEEDSYEEDNSDEGYDEENGAAAKGDADDDDDDDETAEEEEDEEAPSPKKAKKPKKAAAKKAAMPVAKKRKLPSTPTKKSPAAKVKKDAKGKKSPAVDKKKKEKKKKEEKPKGPKLKGKLKKIKPDLEEWVKDPFFEGNDEVPFVSSWAHSKLLFRAINNRSAALLKKLIADKKQVYSLEAMKSLQEDLTPMQYAVKTGWMEGVRILAGKEAKSRKGRVGPPACLLETAGTGEYNVRHLGIRHVRRLNMSRGNREGNNAFTKDRNHIAGAASASLMTCLSPANVIQWGASLGVFKELKKMKILDSTDNSAVAHKALRYGRLDIAALVVERDIKESQLGSFFSRYHLEALTHGDRDTWDPAHLREVSVRKKAGYIGGTPLHFA